MVPDAGAADVENCGFSFIPLMSELSLKSKFERDYQLKGLNIQLRRTIIIEFN